MHKRSQAEVMGLLVIVILLVFIGLIYIRFSLKGSQNPYGSVREGLEGTNLLSSLLKLNLGEGSLQQRILGCSYDSVACEGLQLELEDIFSIVLKPGEDYRLVVLAEDGNELFGLGGCGRGIVSVYHFIEEGELFEARMTICRIRG